MSLRILHSVCSLDVRDGGPARSVPALAQAEAESGADVILWSDQKPTIDLTPFPDVTFVSGDISRLSAGQTTPDVIHDHGLWLRSNHAAARFGRHNRIPRIVSPRGMLEPWCLRHHRIRKEVAWKLYQHRDLLSSCGLHATSESECAQFRNLGFRQPIISLPNGVTLPPESSEISDTAPSEHPREILFLSRLHPVKNLQSLITAWANVVHDNWHLRIIGSGEDSYRRELDRLVDSLRLRQSVTLEEAVHSDRKWDYFQRADAVVLPSYSENFGIVIAEALGVGTPVLVTTGMPWSEVPTRKCGWQVEPTVSGLTGGLRSVLNTSKADLAAMGIRGSQWVRKEFAWTDIGNRMLAAYHCLLGHETNSQVSPQIQTLLPAA